MNLLLTLFFFLAAFADVKNLQKPVAEPSPDWTFVEQRLKKEGFSSKSIRALKKNYEPKHFVSVLKLNVLLFLVTKDYHGVQVTEEGTQKVKSFLSKNEKVFAQAEKEFGVPRHVIASLLWIETRHGQNQGSFHVASSYLHLVQAPRKSVQDYLQSKATDYNQKVTPRQRQEILKRTKTKSDWAIKELRALDALYKKSPKLAMNLRGSFSGAFGLPQFLPTSYHHWARSSRRGHVADLYKPSDAIMSVAHYLKKHGWKTSKPKTHIKALMKYNNSRDYAEAILKLADRARGPQKAKQRLPAQKRKK